MVTKQRKRVVNGRGAGLASRLDFNRPIAVFQNSFGDLKISALLVPNGSDELWMRGFQVRKWLMRQYLDRDHRKAAARANMFNQFRFGARDILNAAKSFRVRVTTSGSQKSQSRLIDPIPYAPISAMKYLCPR